MKRIKYVHPMAAINALAAARKIVLRGRDGKLSRSQRKIFLTLARFIWKNT